jgi:hypothetical protein
MLDALRSNGLIGDCPRIASYARRRVRVIGQFRISFLERFARLTSELGFGRFKTRGSRCDLKSICSQIDFRERVCHGRQTPGCQQCRSNCVGNVLYQATWKYLCRSRNRVVAADSPTVSSAQIPSSAPLLLLDTSYLDSEIFRWTLA